MKNTELMVGNYIMDSHTGRIGYVISFSNKKAVVKLHHSTLWQDIEEFEPIPLTEEMLLKCGFTVYDIKYKYFSHKGVPGILQLFDGVAEYSIDSNEVCWVDGLHQLQNLYHALTGQELKIEL